MEPADSPPTAILPASEQHVYPHSTTMAELMKVVYMHTGCRDSQGNCQLSVEIVQCKINAQVNVPNLEGFPLKYFDDDTLQPNSCISKSLVHTRLTMQQDTKVCRLPKKKTSVSSMIKQFDVLNHIPVELERFCKFMDSVVIRQRKSILGQKQKYAQFEKRWNSFKKWKTNSTNIILNFVEAGFFYSGQGSNFEVTTFCCNKVIRNWVYVSDPWIEHSMYTPNCPYINLKLGKCFIAKVHHIAKRVFTMSRKDYSELFHQTYCKCEVEKLKKEIIGKNRTFTKSSMQASLLKLNNSISPIAEEKESRACSSQSSQEISIPTLNHLTCKICYQNKIEVLFIPCGHLISCITCAMSLDKCALCREPFNVTTLIMKAIQINKFDNLTNLPYINNPIDPMICKVCRVEEIQVLIVPCHHICTCFECALNMNKCPVCFKIFFGLIQVFLS